METLKNVLFITFDALISQIEKANESELNKQVANLAKAGKIAEIRELVMKSQSVAINKIKELPSYYLYSDGDNSYLADIPAKATRATGAKKSNFQAELKSGDLIQLSHNGLVSPIYKYTSAGLLDENDQPIKASKPVEAFFVDQLKSTRPLQADFKGYAGLSHSYWTIVKNA